MRFLPRRAAWTLVALCATGLGMSIQAQAQTQQRRSTADLKKTFQKMERQTKSNLRSSDIRVRSYSVGGKSAKAQVISGSRFGGVGLEFRIERVADGSREGTGNYVDLLNESFRPKERFYVWLKTATPVQVALIQGYEDGRPDRVVMPDEKFPESFNTLTPNAGYVKFPVLLEMDDDLNPEIMKIAVFTLDTIQKGDQLSAADILGGSAGGATSNLDDDALVSPPPIEEISIDDDEVLTGPSGNELRNIKKTAEQIASLHKSDPDFRRRTRFQLGAAVRGDDANAVPDLLPGTIIGINESARIGVTELKLAKKR